MMLCLIANIRRESVGLRFADGETGIAALPSEIVDPLQHRFCRAFSAVQWGDPYLGLAGSA